MMRIIQEYFISFVVYLNIYFGNVGGQTQGVAGANLVLYHEASTSAPCNSFDESREIHLNLQH